MAFEVFDATLNRLEGGVSRAIMRNSVIAHNISNANNPDFEALEFSDVLNKAVKRSDRKRVVLEEEMADLSKNSMRHSAYIKLLAAKMNVLRNIATLGRK